MAYNKPYYQTMYIKKTSISSSRKLVLHGNMAENHVKALNLRIIALNEQIKINNKYTREIEKQLIAKNLEIEKLKKERPDNIINSAKSTQEYNDNAMNDESILLYVMQA
jgi:hypothetical protein